MLRRVIQSLFYYPYLSLTPFKEFSIFINNFVKKRNNSEQLSGDPSNLIYLPYTLLCNVKLSYSLSTFILQFSSFLLSFIAFFILSYAI